MINKKVIYVFKTHFKFLFCIEESTVEKPQNIWR